MTFVSQGFVPERLWLRGLAGKRAKVVVADVTCLTQSISTSYQQTKPLSTQHYHLTKAMKLTPTLLTLLLSCVAVSNALSLFGGDQHVLDEKLNVPGDNPLTYCREEDHILDIYKVDLEPNPPLA